MTNTYHAQIAAAFEAVTAGLTPFVQERLKSVYGATWKDNVKQGFKQHRQQVAADIQWDANLLLTVIWDHWNSCFKQVLSHADRSMVSELRTFRNQWAHQQELTFDDAYRIVDSSERLLASVHSPQATELHAIKQQIFQSQNSDTIPVYAPSVESPSTDTKVEAIPAVIPTEPEKPVVKSTNHLRNILIYTGCLIAIDVQIYLVWPHSGMFMILFVTVVFTLMIWEQFSSWKKKKARHR
jgi:hypothetical protein